MIWYNGDIHAVYLNGHYHVAAYLGDVLVWRENVRPMQGVEYLMAAAELGAAAVPASELGADAVLPSPRVRHAEMVGAAAGAMQAQEAQQLSVSCGMEALPASLPEMRLPLALDVQGQMAAAGASELAGTETPALRSVFSPVSYAVSLMQAILPPVLRVRNTSLSSAVQLLKVLSMRNRAALTGRPNAADAAQLAGGQALLSDGSLAANHAAVTPADSQAVISSVLLTGAAQASDVREAVLSALQEISLTGGGAVVGASNLPAALGVKLTASCGLELRWDGAEQEGNLLEVRQVYSAVLNGGLLEVE